MRVGRRGPEGPTIMLESKEISVTYENIAKQKVGKKTKNMVTNLLNSCKKSLEHWWRSCEISAYLFGISCIFLEQRLVGLGGVMELVFTLKNVLKTCRPL